MKFSVCITLKNRAEFMDMKLRELRSMNYDPKKLEICVTDGNSTDNLKDVLKANAKYFDQIKYAISDRSKLPFKIPLNNPACDINAQICNVATYDKIIRTDAEVFFTNKNSLVMLSNQLKKRRHALSFLGLRMRRDFKLHSKMDPEKSKYANSRDSFFCVGFDKRDFIQLGGVEEKFAMGFAAEDTYWHWYWHHVGWKLNYSPPGFKVMHMWHGEEQLMKDGHALKKNYTLPLLHRMKKAWPKPNKDNPDWKRPEMILGVEIWKG